MPNMDQNQNAGNVGVAAAEPQSTSVSVQPDQSVSTVQTQPVARKSMSEVAAEIAAERAAKSAGAKPVENANNQQEASETPESQQENQVAESSSDGSQPGSASEEGTENGQSEKHKPWFQKRIDTLSAQKNEAREQLKTLELEHQKALEANRLLMAEFDRIRAKAQLDPHEEELNEYKLQAEIQKLDREIPERVNQTWAEREQAALREEKKREIVEGLKAATAKYNNLFSAEELMSYMAKNSLFNPMEAAARRHKEILAAVSPLVAKAPQAPQTSAGNPSQIRELAQPKRYRSMAEAYADIQASRNGKLK